MKTEIEVSKAFGRKLGQLAKLFRMSPGAFIEEIVADDDNDFANRIAETACSRMCWKSKKDAQAVASACADEWPNEWFRVLPVGTGGRAPYMIFRAGPWRDRRVALREKSWLEEVSSRQWDLQNIDGAFRAVPVD